MTNKPQILGWSKLEEKWLIELYPYKTIEQLIIIFAPRTQKAIESKAYRLGVKKDWRFKQKMFKKIAKGRKR